MELTTVAELPTLQLLQQRLSRPNGASSSPTTPKETSPNCDVCKDNKFYMPDLPYTDPEFGKPVRCQACGDFLRTCRLTPEEQKLEIASLTNRPEDPDGYIPAMRFLAKEMLREPYGFMSIAGLKGAGKSMIAAALVASLARAGYDAVYFTGSEVASKLKDFAGEDNDIPGDPRAFCDRLKRVRVLAIDEADKINWSQWILETWGEVIDWRHRNAERLVTIFTMNLPPSEWPHHPGVYIEHIESRLADGRFHRFCPEEYYSRLPKCLEKHFDMVDGKKKYYCPGLFTVNLPDARPTLRRN